jgi:hypothetical protein
VTAVKRRLRRRASTELRSLTLTPALRGLGSVLGAAAAPRLDFQQDLRERLIDEARWIAAQPKSRPRSSRPRRPKGGGIRLAAIGIGFSLAGGGIVAAAHTVDISAREATASASHAPHVPVGTPPPSSSPVASRPLPGGLAIIAAPVRAGPRETPGPPATLDVPLTAARALPTTRASPSVTATRTLAAIDVTELSAPPSSAGVVPALLDPRALPSELLGPFPVGAQLP